MENTKTGTTKTHGFSDLKDIWAIVVRRKWLITLPFLLVVAVAFAGSFLLTPEYESSTIVAINPTVPLSGELQRLLGSDDGVRRSSDEARNQLKSIKNEITSMQYVQLLSDRLRLDQDPALVAKARKIASEHPDVSEQQVRLDLLQKDLSDKVTVDFVAQDHVSFTVDNKDPKLAQAISINLGEIFVQEKLKQDMTSLRSSQDFSDVQLQKYETELQDKVNQKTSFEKRLVEVQLDAAVTSEQNRMDVKAEVDQTNADISDLQKQEGDLRNSLSRSIGARASSMTLRDTPDNIETRKGINDQLATLASYVTKYPWKDPQVLNVKLKVNALVKSIELENRRLVNDQFGSYDAQTKDNLTQLFNVRADLDVLYSKATLMKAALDELTRKVQLVPEYQATLNRLNQEIATTADLRDKFKSQQASSTISQALLKDMSSSKYRVVEPGKLPLDPVKPDRIKILLMGIALGIMIGGATALVVELLDTSFKKLDDVETYLGLPVLGVAPKIEFMSKVSR